MRRNKGTEDSIPWTDLFTRKNYPYEDAHHNDGQLTRHFRAKTLNEFTCLWMTCWVRQVCIPYAAVLATLACNIFFQNLVYIGASSEIFHGRSSLVKVVTFAVMVCNTSLPLFSHHRYSITARYSASRVQSSNARTITFAGQAIEG